MHNVNATGALTFTEGSTLIVSSEKHLFWMNIDFPRRKESPSWLNNSFY